MSSPPPKRQRPSSFPSHLSTPNVPPNIRLLCDIISSAPPNVALEPLLDAADLRLLSSSDVESVLKLSYSHPAAAVSFFRWAGRRYLNNLHSPYSWNLVVDLLGKNQLFDAMWGAVKSMRSENLLSLATYASIFSSLAAANRPEDALSAFDKMPFHGVPHSTAALNSLLSALCREHRIDSAREAYTRYCPTGIVRPDGDSFVILLEGSENEGDCVDVVNVFNGMVGTLGWDPRNVPAYDSLLVTLFRRGGERGIADGLRFLEMMRVKGCFPGMKFFRAAMEVFKDRKDGVGASKVWELMMAREGFFPDTSVYNSMIELQCSLRRTDLGLRLLDEMVAFGAFPNSQSYNGLLQALIRDKLSTEAVSVFDEMVKNECEPAEDNCFHLLRLLLDSGEWDLALKVWKFMVVNGVPSLEQGGNLVVLSLRDSDKLPEACRYAEEMIERGIKLNSSTLSKLRLSLNKVGKGFIHDDLLRKWKSH